MFIISCDNYFRLFVNILMNICWQFSITLCKAVETLYTLLLSDGVQYVLCITVIRKMFKSHTT